MGRILIWLSGARPEVLAECPGDRPKYLGVGASILFTSTLAGISMAFALHTALRVALGFAIPGALLWALGIMMLDRWLVVSLQRGPALWQTLTTAAIRLGLAVLFGIVVSTPLVLQIFNTEIEAKIVEIHQKDADAFRKQQQSGDVGKAVASLSAQRDALQKIVASGGDVPDNPEADPKIVGLRAQIAATQGQYDKAKSDYGCQLYGPCKPTGPGPLATADKARMDALQGQLDSLNGQVDARKKDLTNNDQASRTKRVADAKAQLPSILSQLAGYQGQQSDLQKRYAARTSSSNGLLERIKALDQISSQDSSLGTTRDVLLLFITTIECLPVLVKTLQILGPENSYEKIAARAEQEEVAQAIRKVRSGLLSPAAKKSSKSGNVEPSDEGYDSLAQIWGPPATTPEPHGPSGGTRVYENRPFPGGGDSPASFRSEGVGGSSNGHQGQFGNEPDPWEDEQLTNMPDTPLHPYSSGEGHAAAEASLRTEHAPDNLLGFDDD